MGGFTYVLGNIRAFVRVCEMLDVIVIMPCMRAPGLPSGQWLTFSSCVKLAVTIDGGGRPPGMSDGGLVLANFVCCHVYY